MIVILGLSAGCMSEEKVVTLSGIVLTGEYINDATAGVGVAQTIPDEKLQCIPGAKVEVLTLGENPRLIATTTTDREGRYQITLERQDAVLRVERPGFKTVERQITISSFGHYLRNTVYMASIPKT
jgi:hypothetical protein